MRLSTRSSILKSTSVEISVPRVLENSNLGKEYKKQTLVYGVPAEFSLLSIPEANPLTGQLLLDKEETNTTQEQEQVQNIISEAKAQAEQIIADATTKAEELWNTALQQSEELKISTEAAVRAEITPLAYAEGLEQGLKASQEEADKLHSQAKHYLELAQQVLRDEYDKAEQELLHLCLQISSKIINASFRLDSAKLLSVIRNLNLLPREKEGIKIHLSSQDWEWYKELDPEEKPSYGVIIDDSLRVGDAFIECAEGIFDARIDSQLEALEQYLLEELEHGRLDGFSK